MRIHVLQQNLSHFIVVGRIVFDHPRQQELRFLAPSTLWWLLPGGEKMHFGGEGHLWHHVEWDGEILSGPPYY